MYNYNALQPKDYTHHTPYSTDFGVIKIKHPIASGGPAPQLQRSSQNLLAASNYNADVLCYIVALPNGK